ncbi:exosortase A [Roseomonas sp. CAU 1739]|uniref:exosortase A n=1 Tax=Roseomonas sp. CAU 1739 TaxID=3140364 RepID=UPI00325B0643
MTAMLPRTADRTGKAGIMPPTGWAAPLLALGVALAAWGALFAPEAAAAVAVWESSTAYNHCWLIPPIALWLGWQRRGRLQGMVPAPSFRAALLLPPLGLGWLVAERLGIMEGRQLAAVAIAVTVVVAILGLRFGRAMAAPLAYLVFLVPFGAFSVPVLQRVTARMIEFLLGLTGIPHYVDDIVIEIPAGRFLVAEACAGLRFLIASVAFGALYALTMFRSTGRRLVVMVLSVVVPILANGLRGFGLVMIGHYSGTAAAVEADHVLYGWLFFSIVLLLLILAGLPFRQDGSPPSRPSVVPPPIDRPRGTVFAAMAAVAMLGITLGPAVAWALDRGGRAEPASMAGRLIPPDGCVAEAGGTRLQCSGWIVSARVIAFPARANWSAVVAARRQALGGSDIEYGYTVTLNDGAARWSVRQSQNGMRAVATWFDGRPAGEGLRDRATQAWNVLRGGDASPVVVALDLQPGAGAAFDPQRVRGAFEQVLAAQGVDLVARAAALSRPR